MTAFIRRFTSVPSIETLTAIETIALIDGTPRGPVIGTGTGTLLLFGEFEDGPFNEPTEVFGDADEAAQFGAFGYQYGSTVHENASARRRLQELWNGNGFLKGRYLRPRRKIIARVDSSVGSVAVTPKATVRSGPGPFRLNTTDQLTVDADAGGPTALPVIVAVEARADGAGAAYPVALTGQAIGIRIDGGAQVNVTLPSGSTALADIILAINNALGYTAASDNAGQLRISGIQQGTGGEVVLTELTAPVLATLGYTPVSGVVTVAGTGGVADIDAVTASELVTLWSTALSGISATANVTDDGSLAISAFVSMQVAAGTFQDSMGFGTDLATAAAQVAYDIPAGTRLMVAGENFVTMQTVRRKVGDTGVLFIPVRHALDDGTGAAAPAATAVTVVDQPTQVLDASTGAAGFTAALSESQLDVRYEAAFDATLDLERISRIANFSLSARRSPAVNRKGRANATDASNEGNFGRKFHARAPYGISPNDAIADVALYRSDRVFYTYPGWQARIPEIAERGSAGGLGFSDDGIITIGGDGPLAYINCALNPEENPGQSTGLLDDFVISREPIAGASFIRQTYEAFKAAGICAPRVDQDGAFVYQSEVTTSLTPGRTTQKRRKMADFIQDTLGIIALPFSKKLATDSRVAGVTSRGTRFLNSLLSPDNAETQRIAEFSMELNTNSNAEYAPNGIQSWRICVRLLSSLDSMIFDTKVGEGVVVISETET